MNLCAGSTYRCYNTIQSRKLKKHITIKLKQTLWKHNGDAPVASERFSNISLNAFPKQSPVTDRPSGRDGTGRNGTWGHTIHCQYNQYTARPFTRTGAMENLAPVGSLKPLGWHPSTARRGPAYRRNPRDSTGKWIEEPSNSTLNGRKHVI